MRIFSGFFAIAAVFLLCGCAPKARTVDVIKSCDALLYESEAIDYQITRLESEAEAARNSGVPLHLFVVGLGVIISAYPVIASVTGTSVVSDGTVYIMPTLTIGYYNLFVAPKETIDRYDYLVSRRETLDNLIQDKQCKKQLQ